LRHELLDVGLCDLKKYGEIEQTRQNNGFNFSEPTDGDDDNGKARQTLNELDGVTAHSF
jgi:hypothetical protein